MDESNCAQGALNAYPVPMPEPGLTRQDWEKREAEEKERQYAYAQQTLRERALGAAISAMHGTPSATDWDAIVKAARVFLAFIEQG